MSSVRSLTTGSVLMLAVRFEEVVSRGAGAAVALFSGAVIREMYRTKILSVKVCRYLLCLSAILKSLHILLTVEHIASCLSRFATALPACPQSKLWHEMLSERC